MDKKPLSEFEVHQIFNHIRDDEPIDRSKWPTWFLIRLMRARLLDLRDFSLSTGVVDISRTTNGLEGDLKELVSRLRTIPDELVSRLMTPPSDPNQADHKPESEV